MRIRTTRRRGECDGHRKRPREEVRADRTVKARELRVRHRGGGRSRSTHVRSPRIRARANRRDTDAASPAFTAVPRVIVRLARGDVVANDASPPLAPDGDRGRVDAGEGIVRVRAGARRGRRGSGRSVVPSRRDGTRAWIPRRVRRRARNRPRVGCRHGPALVRARRGARGRLDERRAGGRDRRGGARASSPRVTIRARRRPRGASRFVRHRADARSEKQQQYWFNKRREFSSVDAITPTRAHARRPRFRDVRLRLHGEPRVGYAGEEVWAVVGNHGKNPVVDQLTERLRQNDKLVYRVNPYGRPPAEYKFARGPPGRAR